MTEVKLSGKAAAELRALPLGARLAVAAVIKRLSTDPLQGTLLVDDPVIAWPPRRVEVGGGILVVYQHRQIIDQVQVTSVADAASLSASTVADEMAEIIRLHPGSAGRLQPLLDMLMSVA